MKEARRAGVLLHISSLPCRHGLGDFGPQAHEFVDFLAQAGHSLWQVLPLTPVNPGAGNSPYSSYAAFAGNTLFISPDMLVRQGLLRREDVAHPPAFPRDRADHDAAASWRGRLLAQAFDNVFPRVRSDPEFLRFCRDESFWLEDYCLFMAIKREQKDAPWYLWPRGLRLRDPLELERACERLGFEILRERYLQYLFALHWENLRGYAAARGVGLFGDVPIYVSLDSCDVWAHRELFELDDEGLPVYCAGAPPDYFSETGQMWGNPVYAWTRHEKDGFAWWIKRLGHENKRFEVIRLDHFRGFCGFWQVPSCERTAENGVWIPGPGRKLFAALIRNIPGLNLVAEDLGVITPDVSALMHEFGFPGMKILQFAFSPEMGKNAYIPHNITPGSVAYTGTHDNNTTRGWFAEELDAQGRERVRQYAGHEVDAADAADVLIRMAMGSVARWCVIPMQDYLGLGGTGRMNIPGVAGGNWGWRMAPEVLTTDLGRRMRNLAEIYGRLPDPASP